MIFFHRRFSSARRSSQKITGVIIPVCLALVIVLLSACSNTGNPSNSTTTSNGIKYGGAVTIVPSPYGLFNRNFNPYLSDNASLSGTRGMIYETLLFFNREKNTIDYWLASSYKWSDDLKTLTFTLRKEVKWTDGQPLTSNDVVFTFNLMHQYHKLDLNSVWAFIDRVEATDPQTVVFHFKKPATPELWYVGGQSYIVPEHIWKDIKDPENELNPEPVGTGPFKLKTFDPALYVLERNPDYWQPGKPYIDLLRYPAYKSNNTAADLLLPQGAIDWTGLFTDKLKEDFVNRDPEHNRYWFPPISVVMLYLNTAKPPFDSLEVRKAISLAIDRERISVEGESGFEPSSHPTGIVLPAHESYLDPNYNKLAYKVDTAQAISLLQQAGYTRGPDGMFVDRSGVPLAFNLNVVSGWTDWEKTCRIIADNLKTIGIAVNVNATGIDPYLNALQMGSYDAAISWANSGPSPYYFYYGLLASENSAKIGESASTNWERWMDNETDTLLSQYSSSNDKEVQQEALAGLQRIMVEKLPAIPLVYNVSWYEYTTKRFAGWPTEDNNYAVPSPYTYPDAAQVALRLHLK